MPSPFYHGNPVAPEHFVGRKRELGFVIARIANYGQSVAVIGEPRIGKTSLLDYLTSPAMIEAIQRESDARILFSYIDAHFLAAGLDFAAFWDHAFHALDDAPEVEPPLRENYHACRDRGFVPRDVSKLLNGLRDAGLRLVLLVDEFDYLVHHFTPNPGAFFSGLRVHATRSRGALALVVASRKSITELHKAAGLHGYSSSPYFNFMEELLLGPLSGDEVDELLVKAKDHFTPEDRSFIHDLAGGHPYLVQALADALWHAYEAGEADPERRRSAARAALLQVASSTLGEIWERWSPSLRYVFLSIVASSTTARPSSPELSNAPELLTALSSFSGELHILEQQGFVQEDPTAESGFRVRARVFFDWCAGELAHHGRSPETWESWARDQGLDRFLSQRPRAQRARKVRLFYAYAHCDDEHRKELDKHLTAMKRTGLLETWSPRQVSPGAEWKGEASRELREADLVLLLVSADFLASDYSMDVEMTLAMERHTSGTARVVPIRVRAADWAGLPFASIPALPKNGIAVTQGSDKDAVWAELATEIRHIVSSFPG